MKFVACCPINTVDGRLYSFGGEKLVEVKGLGRSLKTFMPGDSITAADAGGGEAFAELADADAIAVEGATDARIARQMAARAQEAGNG